MSHRLFLALVLLIAAPLVLLGYLSASTYRDRDQLARNRVDQLLQVQLASFEPRVTGLFDQYSLQLRQAIEKNASGSIPQLQQENAMVRALVMVDRRGNQIYPPKPISDSNEEMSLASALPAIIDSRPTLQSRQVTQASSTAAVQRNAVQKTAVQTATSETTAPTNAWQVWFMDEGMQLIYWQAVDVRFQPQGKKLVGSPSVQRVMIGILLERSRWIADLTARLPDGENALIDRPSAEGQSNGFISLVDQSGQLIYRWGDRSERRSRPIASRALPPPLANWQWQWHDDPLVPAANMASIWTSLASIGLLLLVLGGYVLTSVRRQIHDAMRQVSFASQVSHELRTPLTNIRLYAELAQSDLANLPTDSTREQLLKRIGVIDSESRRLGRLVSGVLEVIRTGVARPPRTTAKRPDQIIEATLTQFEPALESLGFAVESDLRADHEVSLDEDILEMILVNLFSNVEKYAAEGKFLGIASTYDDNELVIRVADRGPGIARQHHALVFKAFQRLDDSISSPSGTGIGLTIARRLAQRHGGSLKLVPGTGRGATFEVRLLAPRIDQTLPAESLNRETKL